MMRSSPGPGPTWEKSGWTTVPSPTSASAAAGAYGRRCGFAETARSYLPDPDGLRGEQQSPAMDEFQERLRKEGLETSWQPTYNAGANPVPIRLRTADIAKPVVQELLRATFQILASGAMPWSERHEQPATDATTAATTGT